MCIRDRDTTLERFWEQAIDDPLSWARSPSRHSDAVPWVVQWPARGVIRAFEGRHRPRPQAAPGLVLHVRDDGLLVAHDLGRDEEWVVAEGLAGDPYVGLRASSADGAFTILNATSSRRIVATRSGELLAGPWRESWYTWPRGAVDGRFAIRWGRGREARVLEVATGREVPVGECEGVLVLPSGEIAVQRDGGTVELLDPGGRHARWLLGSP